MVDTPASKEGYLDSYLATNEALFLIAMQTGLDPCYFQPSLPKYVPHWNGSEISSLSSRVPTSASAVSSRRR